MTQICNFVYTQPLIELQISPLGWQSVCVFAERIPTYTYWSTYNFYGHKIMIQFSCSLVLKTLTLLQDNFDWEAFKININEQYKFGMHKSICYDYKVAHHGPYGKFLSYFLVRSPQTPQLHASHSILNLKRNKKTD